MNSKSRSNVDEIVRSFYEEYGWVKQGDETGEDKSFRKFRSFYFDYYSKVTIQRELSQFDGLRGKLLISGGGDLPENHLVIAQQFEEVYCVDFSQRSLDISREKLGTKANCINASIMDIPIENDYVDAAFCGHVIYHIHKSEQAEAVRQLIRVVRPGGRVVISYSNPFSPQNLIDRTLGYAKWPLRRVRNLFRSAEAYNAEKKPALYFKPFPLHFWKQFKDSCEVQILPWQVLSASQERKYIRSDSVAEKFYRWAAGFEEEHPKIAVRLWSYPLIVLTKRG